MERLRTLGLVLIGLGIIEWSWAVFCVLGGGVLGIAGFADHRMQIPLWVGTGAYLLLAVVSAALGLVHVVTGVRVRSGKGLILLMVSIGACLISMVFALYCFPFSVGALIYSGVVLADPSCRRILDGVEPG